MFAGLEVEHVVFEVGPAEVGVDVFQLLHSAEVLGMVHRGDDTQVVAHDELVGQDCSNVHRLLPQSCRMP
jgi:hypothetical protein